MTDSTSAHDRPATVNDAQRALCGALNTLRRVPCIDALDYIVLRGLAQAIMQRIDDMPVPVFRPDNSGKISAENSGKNT